MGVVIPTELIWNLEFGAVSGLFANETAPVNSLAAVAYLCMVLSSAFESANLTFNRIHLFINSLLYARHHVKSWESKVKQDTPCS